LNRASTTLKRIDRNNMKAIPLKTCEGTVSVMPMYGRANNNPMCCGLRTYKLHYATHKQGRTHAGYICLKCKKMIPKNGEEKQP